MIPKDYLQALEERTVAVIAANVPLTKKGRNFRGACPFHQDADNSFTVTPAKRFYHCFGCQAHGTAIEFVMRFKGVGFVDAVHFLADRAGYPVPAAPTVGASAARKRKAVADIAGAFDAAMIYYRAQLRGSPAAIAFLKERGISGTTAALFKLGYAPGDWSALQARLGADYATHGVAAGLVARTEAGRLFDRFHERLVYPALDYRERVVGIAGQSIDGREPLFLASGRNEAAGNAADFFGLAQAERHIRTQRTVVLAPTCLDVVVLHEYGVRHAVAILRTSTMKEEQFEFLFTKADRIVCCCLDTKRGRSLAWTMVKRALPQVSGKRSVAIALVPAAETAETLVRQEDGAHRFALLLRAATPLSEFFLQQLAVRHRDQTLEGRAALLEEAAALLERVTAPHLRRLLSEAVDDMANDRNELLKSAGEHDRWLADVLDGAIDSVLIVSPWITRQGIERFDLCARIAAAVRRGVAVSIYTDVTFNLERKRRAPQGDLFDDGSHALLTAAGAHVIFVTGVHSKVVVCDTRHLAVGSFNWLSAARAGRHRRHEVSVVQHGGGIAAKRRALLQELMTSVADYAG